VAVRARGGRNRLSDDDGGDGMVIVCHSHSLKPTYTRASLD
jgi:hypothetical protein